MSLWGWRRQYLLLETRSTVRTYSRRCWTTGPVPCTYAVVPITVFIAGCCSRHFTRVSEPLLAIHVLLLTLGSRLRCRHSVLHVRAGGGGHLPRRLLRHRRPPRLGQTRSSARSHRGRRFCFTLHVREDGDCHRGQLQEGGDGGEAHAEVHEAQSGRICRHLRRRVHRIRCGPVLQLIPPFHVKFKVYYLIVAT